QKSFFIFLDTVRHYVVDEIRYAAAAYNLLGVFTNTTCAAFFHVIEVVIQFTNSTVLDFLILDRIYRQREKAVRLLSITFAPCAQQNQVFPDEHTGKSRLQRTTIIKRHDIFEEQLTMLIVGLKDDSSFIAL